jgi:rhodanese-related sulfurtransferase
MGSTIKSFSSLECFERLVNDPNSHLIDVRTKPEWDYVGVPDLSSINKQVTFVSWQIYPEMTINKFFENQVLRANINKTNNLFFICRSGWRSLNAAKFLTSSGFTNCFNVSDGFEGKINQDGNRSLVDGWQFNNLPWRQE